MSRRVFLLLLVSCGCALRADAQTLRSEVQRLFTFGCPAVSSQLICLDLSAPFQHGTHFNPSADTAGLEFVSFVQSSIGISVANTPITSAAGGKTFRFEGGRPVATSTSAGPILGERAQTLGRGRFFVGFGFAQMDFQELRGVPLGNVAFTFTHEDVDSVGNPTTNNLGNPNFENDVINVKVAMDVSLMVASLSMSYGLVDGIDVGVTVPFVRTSIRGTSTATIVPANPQFILHFFDSTSAGKIVTARSSASGVATGLGDVEGHIKINIAQGQRFGAALFGSARFPTGDADNLLGTRRFSARGLGIVSANWGTFSPHLNVGYTVRDDSVQNNTIDATLGYDQLISPWATMAFDVVSAWQVGPTHLQVPKPVQYVFPVARTLAVTNIPQQPDNYMSVAVGFKFTTKRGIQLVSNASFPVRNSGLQPGVIWTGSIGYNF